MRKIIQIMVFAALVLVAITGCSNAAPTAEVASPAEAVNPTEAAPVAATEAPTEAAKEVVIAVAMNTLDEYRTNWLASFTSGAEAKGYKVISTNAGNDVSKHISDVESLLAQNPDIVVLTPIDAVAALPAAEAVKAAGIPLLVIDIPITGNDYGSTLVIDQGIHGTLIGEYLCQWLAEDTSRVANVGYIVGQYVEVAMPRMDKIFETCPAATKVVEAEGGWSADNGMRITEDWLQSNPDINVIAAMNDEMAIGAIQALTAAGVDMENYLVFGVDGTANGQVYIRSGELDATSYVNLDSFTLAAVETAEKLINGEKLDPMVSANQSVVLLTKDNIDEIIK